MKSLQRADNLPRLYQRLLAANRLITTRLENYLCTTLQLQPLHVSIRHHTLSRHVIISTTEQQPVEYAHITIALNKLPATIVEQILANDIPLGRILDSHGFTTRLRVQSLLQLPCSKKYADLFHLKRNQRHTLYGRKVILLDQHYHPFAESMDILTPLHQLHRIKKTHPAPKC